MIGLLQCTIQVIIKSIRTFIDIMKFKSNVKYSALPTHEGHFKSSTVTWLQLCKLTGFKVLECFLCLDRCGCLTWLLKKLDRSLEKRQPLDEAIELGHMDISRSISDIEDRDREIERLRKENDNLIVHNRTLEKDRKGLSDLNRNLQGNNLAMAQENMRLQKENLIMVQEKNDAMTRLSAMLSGKLRDNNPNIVDLNDQFRPTKLAEMFSELYDNEWTDAYAALEKLSSHEKIVQCLLDILMESYSFCGAEMDRNWELVCDWFYDQNLPNVEALRTSLKDARKQKVRQKAKDMEERYLGSLKQLYPVGSVMHTALQVPAMQTYISQTVVLCLYMTTTDPPVVLGCPGWQSTPNREEVARTSSHERSPFNKDMFKEYTERGPYLEYVVWPAMFLYKDGPLLAKGVAQGTKSQLP